MSYQRWTEGDAYVIGSDGENNEPVFWCVACASDPCHFHTYRQIIDHLNSIHENSNVAISRLETEAENIGYDKNWRDYLNKHQTFDWIGDKMKRRETVQRLTRIRDGMFNEDDLKFLTNVVLDLYKSSNIDKPLCAKCGSRDHDTVNHFN